MARPGESKSTREMTESHRKRIQTGNLLNRLQQFAEGKIEISRDRLKAHEILLRKTLPDLSATDLTTKGGSVSFTMNIGKPKK